MQSTTVKQVTLLLRRLLYLGGAFTLIGGFQLIAGARHTDDYFAWTIKPAATAAVLGAFFWGTTAIAWLSARERIWARARGAVPAAVAFTVLTLAATLIHIDRFHLANPSALTRLVTYVWVAVYAIAAPALTVLYYLQLRAPGGDPARGERLPGLFRLLLGIQSAIAVAVGAGLFIAPAAMIPIWGWDLTPLSARALGAWLIPLSIVGAQAIWENDWERVKASMIGLFVMAVIQVVAFAVFYDGVLLASAAALAWVGFWLLVLVIGGYGSVEALRVSRERFGNPRAAEAA